MRNIALLVIAIPWSALLVHFQADSVRNIILQVASRTYSSASGWITHSEITRKGTQRHIERSPESEIVHDVRLHYRYQVGETNFIGTRLRYNNSPRTSGNAAWAQTLLAAYPTNAPAQVFYNPRNPADSLLEPGLAGCDLVLMLLLTPFNCVMLGLWAMCFPWLYRKLFRPIAGGVNIRRVGSCQHVRLPRFRSGLIVLIVVGALSFLSPFVIGSHPTLAVAAVTWAAVLIIATAVYLFLSHPVRSGAQDLIIHPEARTIVLPKTFGRKERVEISFDAIREIWMDVIEHRGRNMYSYSYAPSLKVKNAPGHVFKLADWRDRDKAEAFVRWLREQLATTSADRI